MRTRLTFVKVGRLVTYMLFIVRTDLHLYHK